MNKIEDSYKSQEIMDFLKNYGGKPYHKEEEKKQKGQNAIRIFENVIIKNLMEKIKKYNKNFIIDTSNQNRWDIRGTRVKNEFWKRVVYNDKLDFPISVSIFARGSNEYNYLCCLELDNNKAKKYKNIEDIYKLYCNVVQEKNEKLDYISVINDKIINDKINKENIIKDSKDKGYFTIRLGKKIEIGEKNDKEIVKEIFEVFKLLIMYYNKIINLSKELTYKEIEFNDKKQSNIMENQRNTKGYNKIFFGAPGVGKSYTVEQKLKEVEEKYIFRITFHPEFTYNDFIGQIIPTIKKTETSEEIITYEFKEGEFTKALKKAYANPDKDIYLKIEEMSRGNCAAIFGDIFQLLDRDEKTNWSEYTINNDLIASKVLKEVENIEEDKKKELEEGKIRIPSNMYILGTANISDQNVFAMDTAFKRRFEWEYINTIPKDGIYFNDIEIKIVIKDKYDNIQWSKFYCVLNKFICGKEYLELGEDKQIGQAFIKFEQDNKKVNEERIRNKLLNYLWFDIEQASYKSEIKLFDENISSFSDLYEESELNDKEDEEDNVTRINGKIFSQEFLDKLGIKKG